MERTLTLSMRPHTFDDMIGNSEIIAAVKNLLDKGKVPVAFMFVGPYGTGKTTIARIVARELQGFDFPMDQDPELIEINAADDTKIDDMRELAQQAGYRPLVGKYKVIILDEAHKLGLPAQNMLLKEWEKENSPTVWIVCTTESKKIIKGLQDRSYKLELKLMTPADREKLVARAAATLKEPLAPELIKQFLGELSKAGVGSPREILMAFERLSNGVPPQDSVLVEKTDPKYAEVVYAACYGSWVDCAKRLREINDQLDKEKRAEEDKPSANDDADDKGETKAGAAQALRGIAGGFLRSMLLGNAKKPTPATGAHAQAIYEAIRALQLSTPQQHDPALAFPAVCAALYKINSLVGKH